MSQTKGVVLKRGLETIDGVSTHKIVAQVLDELFAHSGSRGVASR